MPIRRATPQETHQSIKDQIADFLKSGGQITQIPSGTSGKKSIADSKHEKVESS